MPRAFQSATTDRPSYSEYSQCRESVGSRRAIKNYYSKVFDGSTPSTDRARDVILLDKLIGYELLHHQMTKKGVKPTDRFMIRYRASKLLSLDAWPSEDRERINFMRYTIMSKEEVKKEAGTSKPKKEKKPSKFSGTTTGLNVNGFYKHIFEANFKAKLSDSDISKSVKAEFPESSVKDDSYIRHCRNQFNKGALQGGIQDGPPSPKLPEFRDSAVYDRKAVSDAKKAAAKELAAKKKADAAAKKKAAIISGEKVAADKTTVPK